MNGKKIKIQKNVTEKCHSNNFIELFGKQKAYQHMVLSLREDFIDELPCDSIKWFSYHIQAMVEEMGEVMKADKRWKTHRNGRFEEAEKLDEIADLFITVLNIAMYSNIDAEELFNTVENKIAKNIEVLV